MKYVLVLALLSGLFSSGCALFERRKEEVVEKPVEKPAPEPSKRTTRRSLEEESMLGESSGSLWNNRGQSAFLFSNNSQHLLGDALPVKVEGYPKEQIQLKVNTLAKMLAQILNDQRQDIKAKDEEWQKKNAPPTPPAPAAPGEQADVKMRAPASAAPATAAAPVKMNPENEKALREVDQEADEVKELQSAKEFPIRTVPTRVQEILKDGSYRVSGEKPFYIGKREYKLKVAGIIKPENFDDNGVSAEVLMEPTFDVVSEKKSEEL